MTTTTADNVQTAIGAQIIAQTALTTDNVKYQMDPPKGPYENDEVYINNGNIEKTKLLKNLFKNNAIIHIVCWVTQRTADPVNIRTDLNSLLAVVQAGLAYDATFGGLCRQSSVVSIVTDAGAFASGGKAKAIMFLNCTYFTVN